MSDRLIVSMFLLVISTILALTGSWAVVRPGRGRNNGQISINFPVIGTITTNYLAMGVAFLSLLLAWFVFSLWKDQPTDTIDVAGIVTVDPAALSSIDAVVIGVTASPFAQTVTPSADGKLRLLIPVPKNWNSYTAYAFTYGGGRVRPAIVGVNLNDPKFQLDLKP
jgi:hypothetical protein